MKSLVRKVLYSVLVSILSVAHLDAAPRKFICSTEAPKGSLHVTALEKFSEHLEAYSKGQLTTQNHFIGNPDFPNIRGEETNMNMVMYGTIPPGSSTHINCTIIASGNASRKASILDFLMLPYIFPDTAAANKLLFSDYMLRDINNIIAVRYQVRAVGWLIGGFRHLSNSKKPITRLDDIKGMLIRTPQNRLMMATYLSFGARVTALAWGETFDALKQDMVDGQENPYSVIVEAKFWNANQKYVTNNGPFLYTAPILINEGFYQSLSPDLQEAVNKAGLEASRFALQWSLQQSDMFKSTLKKKGMQILDLEDKPEWIKASRHIWDENYANTPEKKEVLKNVLAILQKEA